MIKSAGNRTQLFLHGLLWVMLLLGLLLGGIPQAAMAEIQITPQVNGQVLYQSRQKLQDQRGYTWTAITFKLVGTGETVPLQLRLVGFPGTVNLDHRAPLIVKTSNGETLEVKNQSDQVSKTNPTEPHVGQYQLQAVLLELGEMLLIDLNVPTVEGPDIQLPISPEILHEWQTVTACSATWCEP